MSLEQSFRSGPISKRHSGFAAHELIGNDVIISPSECTSSRVLALHDYWLATRGDRLLPGRKDVDPIDFWKLLPYVHMSEWHTNPDGVFFRIAGTEIVATLGREFRGTWLADTLTDPEDLQQIMQIYYRVVATKVPIFGRTDSSTWRHGVEFFEWILCPLSDDGKTVTHFIGLEDYVSMRRYLGGVPQ